jgi:hypothetical protein
MIGVAAWHSWGSGVWVLTGSFGIVAAVLVAAGAGLSRVRPADDPGGPDEPEDLTPATTSKGGD